MGVRESVAQSPEKEMRLQGMTIETDEKSELVFDAEEEISGEDWLAMEESLEHFRQLGLMEKFYRQASDTKILSPDRVKKLELDDELWQQMSKILAIYRHEAPGDFILLAAQMKILFPKRAVELNMDDQAWQNSKKYLEHWRKDKKWRFFSEKAVEMKLLFPNKFSELNLSEEEQQNMLEQLEKYRASNDWHHFIILACGIKVAFPDLGPKIRLDGKAQKGVRACLEEKRHEENWRDFSRVAMGLKILAAKEVRITSAGLECVMPSRESFKEEKKPRPVRREF